MKLISVILNELIDLERTYDFFKPKRTDVSKGTIRVFKYYFCTNGNIQDGDFNKCKGFLYKVEFNEDFLTKGIHPPLFDLSFGVPAKTIDGGDKQKTVAAKGDAGNYSYETQTDEHDNKVYSTVVKITKDFIKDADNKYPIEKGGYAITWEGTFGDEHGHDAGQSKKDTRERVYKLAVDKFKGDHKNLEVVDETESPTSRIQLRFNSWSPAE